MQRKNRTRAHTLSHSFHLSLDILLALEKHGYTRKYVWHADASLMYSYIGYFIDEKRN